MNSAAEQHTRAEERSARKARLAQLMAQTGTGDHKAFETLYEEIAPLIYGTARRVLQDPDHAAEVAQDVLLEIWRSASSFNPAGGSVQAWAATIAHRRAVDRVRAVQSQRSRDEQVGARNFDPPRDAVVEESERRLEREQLLGCLETLSQLQRSAVCSAYYGGATYREVAEQAGTALSTMKSRIRDGLRRLRECLEVQR